MAARPRHVQGRASARVANALVEQKDILAHSRWVFDRKRALLLQSDTVVAPALDFALRFALVPVSSQRSAANADQPMHKLPPVGCGQRGDQAWQVVSSGEAVTDEQNFQGPFVWTRFRHAPSPSLSQPRCALNVNLRGSDAARWDVLDL